MKISEKIRGSKYIKNVGVEVLIFPGFSFFHQENGMIRTISLGSQWKKVAAKQHSIFEDSQKLVNHAYHSKTSLQFFKKHEKKSIMLCAKKQHVNPHP